MYNGGVTVNQRAAQIIRYSGLVVPVVLVFYGLLIQNQVVDTSHYVSDGVFFAITLPWMAVACYQFLFPIQNTVSAGLLVICNHVLASAYILFVSGLDTPFAVAWSLLFLAAYVYFSESGLRLSIMLLVAVVAADSSLHVEHGEIILVDILTLLTILSIGVIATYINKLLIIDKAELNHSQAQETLQQDRVLTIVNNLADAILSTDDKGIISMYNAASLNLLDTNSSLNGRSIDDVLSLYDQDNNPVRLFKDFKKTHSVVTRDDVTMTQEGETMRLEVTYSPIRSSYSRTKKSETEEGYIIILRDITKAKSLEEERDEFISVVSHELRTPITITEGTISNVQLMLRRSNVAKGVLEKAITAAHDQVIFLAKMVNDLSTLSRAERGVADASETIDVRNMVNDLFSEYAPQAEKKDLHFNLDLTSRLGHVTASRLYLQELLQNFITNSIKYTKEGSVTLAVRRKDDEVTFEVKDTGIGISKGDQEKIFNKFYRSEDYRTRETGGTGLGLYVAVKLAKKLGTKIEMSSRLNHGSSFSFTLPVDDKSSR